MNVQQWADALIASDKREAIPIMTHPGIEMAGRTVLEAVSDGTIHFEAIRRLQERFPQAAAGTVVMDLTVEAEAFGAQLHRSPNEVPSVIGRRVSSLADVEALCIPTLAAGRVGEYLRANRLAAAELHKPTFGGCIGPFSLAGRLFDMTEIMMAIYTEPETIRALLEKCTGFIRAYVEAIKQTGVAGVIMAEPAAGLLSNDDCMAFSSVYIRRIVEQVQDREFGVILHNCGNTGHCTQAMVATGAMGYHFGNRADMVEALEACPRDVLVMGNLDPVGVFKNCTPEQVEQATSELLCRTQKYANFVLSSGCDTPPEVPTANIEAFYRALAQHCVKRVTR